jgi:hypothetical protein
MGRKSFMYEYVKHYIEEESGSGCKLISENYNNIREKLILKCNCGNEFSVSLKDFKDKGKRKCKECVPPHNRLSYIEVKKFIEIDSNSGCELISNNYETIYTPLTIKCSCGMEFEKLLQI